VAEVVLQDALWPEADGDAASNAFSTTLHRLRKMLRYEKAIRVFHGKISLDERICWVDVRMMERHLKEAENQGEKGRRVDLPSRLLKFFEKAIDSGPGVFLPDESASWAIPLRERLKARLLLCLEGSVAFHAESGEFEKAIYRCNLGLEIDPCCEEFYQHLMNLYQTHGRPSQAHAAYRRCRENLAAVHGIEPSQKTKNILLRVQSS
jgi:DNA-binding SARP family transcriptional activator